MQRTSMRKMRKMHNTFWHENQVAVSFYSQEKMTTSSRSSFYEQLNQYRLKLNAFLAENGFPFALEFFSNNSAQRPLQASPGKGDNSNPPGIYVFELLPEVQPGFPVPIQDVKIQTGLVGFFRFTKVNSMQPAMAGIMSETGAKSTTGNDDDNEQEDHDKDERKRKPQNSKIGAVPRMVNLINANLKNLNKEEQYKIPILAAGPNYLCGATGGIGQGCPVIPPIPVPDDVSCPSSSGLWPIALSEHSSDGQAPITTAKGKGVTVFILDTLPKREEITRAANAAGANNKLLYDVDKNVKFRYDYDSMVDTVDVPGPDQISVGKDIYGRHSNFNMPDHGLFIAGVVRSLASDANIECIRVLNDSCIGDMNVVLKALQDIHDRMSDGGNLHKKPVVINMSLVIPTDEEAKQKGIDPTLGGDNSIRTHLLLTIQSLVELGAVFAASAGNEGDLRENTSGRVPFALYPAAFANDNIKGIISVGAADGNGKPASYSCYPGINGITVYGGEIPKAIPAKHPSKKLHTPGCFTHAKGIDALVGIYSSSSYPSLSINDCEPTYPVPNNNAWAYWVGTSFATPIISGILARILEMKGTLDFHVHLLVHITNAAPAGPITWANLDTSINPTGTEIGRMVQVTQCPPHRSEEEGKREAEVAAG